MFFGGDKRRTTNTTSQLKTNNSNSSFDERLSRTINDSYPIDFSHLASFHSSSPKIAKDTHKDRKEKMPMDLRIGAKVRIISKKPFPWMNNSRTTGLHDVKISNDDVEKALNLSRNGYAEYNDGKLLQRGISRSKRTALSVLFASTLYYESTNQLMFTSLGSSASSQEKSKMDSVVTKWQESLDNLYESWRTDSRRLFYVLCASFTTLFVHVGQDENLVSTSSDSLSSYRIAVTPTNIGFKELLRSEGIRFTYPLRLTRKQQEINTPEFEDEECARDFWPNSPDESAEMDEDEWLKDIGISPRKNLRKRKRKNISFLDFSNESDCDSRTATASSCSKMMRKNGDEESSLTTILIDETSVENFYLLLRNLRIGVSKSGSLSGCPPLLVASTPFLDCISKRLSMSSQVIKKTVEVKYVLELQEGHVLPSTSRMLIEFLTMLSREETNDEENLVQIQVTGRNAYSGLNEAIDSKRFGNYTDFDADLSNQTFSW